MGKLTQQGIAAWVVILALVGVVGLSAVAGVFLLQKFDNEATEQANRGTTQTRPVAKQNRQQGSSGDAAPQSQVEAQKTATKPRSKAAPIPEVDLTLKGVITRNDPKRSRALIAKGNEAEQTYLSGDSVLSNVSLDSVADDHVVLKIAGQRETLYLNQTLQGAKPSDGRPIAPPLAAEPVKPSDSRVEADEDEAFFEDEDDGFFEDDDEDWDDEDWDEDEGDSEDEDEDDW